MNKQSTYLIAPSNEAFESWTAIDIPILTNTHDDVKRHAEQHALNFSERMHALDFYIEDSTASRFQNSEGNPWHLVRVTERDGNRNPFHFYCGWYYSTREEAILVARLANWFRYDRPALNAVLACGPFDECWLSCEINGTYGRDYWINWPNSR